MLATVAIILAGLGVVVTGWLVWNFARDTDAGMVAVSHKLDQLPNVMTGRYAGFFMLALAAVMYGDLKVIAVLYAVFAFCAFWDAGVYQRLRGQRSDVDPKPHFVAGLASVLVSGVAVWADGVHFRIRLEDDRLCTLVLIGVREDGSKELIAVEDGRLWLASGGELVPVPEQNVRKAKVVAYAASNSGLLAWLGSR